MKKSVKSQPEPVCLADFRKANPAATWEQFRDHQDVYDAIRSHARRDQGGLCAYCEMDLERANEQVAHFHPKGDNSGSINWALEWMNLWLACKGGSQTWMSSPHHYLPPLPENLSCDEYKRAKILDDMVLAPHEIPAFPRIFRFEQHLDRIEIHVDENACNQAGIDVIKAQQTIEEFNLNCSRLARARLALYRELEQGISKLRQSHINPHEGYALLAKKHLAKDSNGHWPRFFTLVRWRLRQVADDYLQKIGYDG